MRYRLEAGKQLNKLLCFIRNNNHVPVALGHEALLDLEIKEFYKLVEITGNVEKTERFFVNAQLCPGYYLKELFQRAKTAGHCDKTIGKLVHLSLSLVHSLNDPELGQPLMRDFLIRQASRDYANCFGSSRHSRIRDDSHQTDVPAAINQINTLFCQDQSKLSSADGVLLLVTCR